MASISIFCCQWLFSSSPVLINFSSFIACARVVCIFYYWPSWAPCAVQRVRNWIENQSITKLNSDWLFILFILFLLSVFEMRERVKRKRTIQCNICLSVCLRILSIWLSLSMRTISSRPLLKHWTRLANNSIMNLNSCKRWSEYTVNQPLKRKISSTMTLNT